MGVAECIILTFEKCDNPVGAAGGG